MGTTLNEELFKAMTRLRQWARFFVGRVTGSTVARDPFYLHMLELGESRNFHRVELNALIALLVRKRVFTELEWTAELIEQARLQEADIGKDWPEVGVDVVNGRGCVVVKDAEALAARTKREGWPQ